MKSHLTGQVDRLNGLAVAVGTAQLFQQRVVIGLHPQGNPVKPLGLEPFQQLFRDGVRIGLKGDLRIIGQVKPAAQGVHDGNQTVRAQKGRGSTAKVHRVHLIARRQSPCLFDVAAHGLQVAFHQSLFPGTSQGIKVAVLTLAAAKRDMHVDSQGDFFVFCHTQPLTPRTPPAGGVRSKSRRSAPPHRPRRHNPP